MVKNLRFWGDLIGVSATGKTFVDHRKNELPLLCQASIDMIKVCQTEIVSF